MTWVRGSAGSWVPGSLGSWGPRVSLVTGCLAVMTMSLPAQQVADPAKRTELRTSTQQRLDRIAGDLDGVMGYVIVDLTSGERFERLPREPFPLASTIKIAILYELFKQAEEGRLKLDVVLPLDKRHVVGGSGVLNHLSSPAMSLRDYAVLMIVLSDNSATNLLIDTVGMENVRKRMTAAGLPGLQLRRRMIDLEAARRGDENVGSPDDLARLLLMIHKGEGLQPASRDGILQILRKPKTSALRDGVPAAVPVANKTGSLDGVSADAGIVYLADRPYIFVATTTYLKTGASGDTAIRAASRVAFDYFDRVAKSSEFGRIIK
jgi:beta-lactamase class A